jgi:uncharacterized protein YjbI with pentapeptide repeats
VKKYVRQGDHVANLISEVEFFLEGSLMNINRRNALLSAVSLGAATYQSVRAHAKDAQVSQDELDEAIRLHGIWLADMKSGQRCVFGGRDLSGLQFGILVHHCSFHGARFDGCHWRQPVFAFADMRRASAKRVIWGTPGPRDLSEPPRADFSHVVLRDADLTEARICGYFYGTKLVGASLVRADFCHSNFLGPKHYEMTFSGAQMRGAKLRHCQISSATFFNADCAGVDFSHTVFSDVRMDGCNLSDACFRNAEFERWMITPGPMRDT